MNRYMKKSASKKKTTAQKRKKRMFSDGLQAFFLALIIVIAALAISLTIISIHSALNRKNNVNNARPPVSQQQNDNISVTAPVSEDNVSEDKIENNVNDAIPVAVTPKPPVTPDPPPPVRNTSTEPPRNTVVRPVDTENTVKTNSNTIQPKPVENQGTIVFVIDDAGNNLRELEPFLRIPGPLTIAVLPGLPYSAEAARRIRAAGKEAILHQPMEAIGAQDPGPGAIFSGMSAQEIREILSRNIAEVGPVAGMNNHQGSKITMDKDAMRTILAFCAENNLYFLDSRTTADTVVPAIANQMGIKIAERNVFIDNEQNKTAMSRYISGGLTRAQKNGLAVMIGHTWSPDLAPLLTEQYPLLLKQGYTIKTASDIIK